MPYIADQFAHLVTVSELAGPALVLPESGWRAPRESLQR